MDALKAEVERLRKALEQYADENNWDQSCGYYEYGLAVWDGEQHHLEIARAALKETDT